MVLQHSLGARALLVSTRRAPASPAARAARRLAAAYSDCSASPLVAAYRAALAGPGGAQGACGAAPGACGERQQCTLSSWGEGGSPPPACRALPSNRTCGGGGAYDEEVGLLLQEPVGEVGGEVVGVVGGLGSRVQGLGCDSNTSLTVHLVDPWEQQALVAALGLPQGWEGALVVAVGEEQVYLGQGVAEEELEELVLGWHRGEVRGRPGLRSSAEVWVEEEVQGGRVEEVSRLREVSVSSLEEVVSPSTPGAVVLYTSPFCTHCTVASHVVHTVQRLLHPVHLLGIRQHI